jgi:hypothetical protein
VAVPSGAPTERGRGLSIDDQIEKHFELVALVIVGLGFALRLLSATRFYLDADESLHYLIANQTSLAEVYRASLTNAHPPFLFLLLFFWRLLGNSELVLRLVSILAGTAACWVGSKWLAYRFGKTTGLVGLLLLVFCPTLVILSATVRQYAPLLLAMTLALYYLERGLRERSERMLLWFALALSVANTIQFSAIWFTVAVGLYALVRIVRERLPGRWTCFWVGTQFLVLALLAFQYLTHIRPLRGSGREQFAREGWLQTSYFRAGQEGLLAFVARSTDKLFTYLFSSQVAGLVALSLLVAAVVTLFIRHRPRPSPVTPDPGPRSTDDSSFGLLLVTAFAVSVLAALAGLYPFGGSRHCVFLILFAVAGISVLLGRSAGRRLGAVLLAAVVIMPTWQGAATVDPKERLPDQNRELMIGAIKYVRDAIPGGSLLFVDCQTALLLGYYLGRNQIDSQTIALQHRYVDQNQISARSQAPRDGFIELSYGGYRVVSTPRWNFSTDNFWAELRAMKQRYGLGPAVPVWVVDGGWDNGLGTDLLRFYPERVCPGLRAFGRNLSVFQVREAEELPGSAAH